jgi:uncharacterized membrane protein YeaQ/YmgE (transglycosylase-associated protein family)
MDRLRDPFLSIVLVILIGVACGALAQRFGRRSRAPERLAPTRGLLTHVLIGIAGAFLGFHAAMLTGLGVEQPIVPFAVTALVASLMLWGWRAARA